MSALESDYAAAFAMACASCALDGARAAAPHVRTALRRFREAVGSGNIVVGPVSVSLAPTPREPSRIVTGHVATRGRAR